MKKQTKRKNKPDMTGRNNDARKKEIDKIWDRIDEYELRTIGWMAHIEERLTKLERKKRK